MDHLWFTDSAGIRWSVSEDGADVGYSSARSDDVVGAAWLRFESDGEVRRLWHYPDDWGRLDPLQLESLLERASTVIARFRSPAHSRAKLDARSEPTGS